MADDLKILPAGVLTEIGERGINLSGGQKARVALARAIYDDADLYLLDDPLSAVDAHVGEHIFRVCIKEYLQQQRGKTVILVTHHLHVLPGCDLIVVLDDDGSVKISGSYEDIMRAGVDVNRYVKEPSEEGDEGVEGEGEGGNDADVDELLGASHGSRMESKADEHTVSEGSVVLTMPSTMPTTLPSAVSGTVSSSEEVQPGSAEEQAITVIKKLSDPSLLSAVSASPAVSHRKTSRKSGKDRSDSQSHADSHKESLKEKEALEARGKELITKEERNFGSVALQTYLNYVVYGGVLAFSGVCLLQACSQVLSIYANFWLTDWGEETTEKKYFEGSEMSMSRNFYWFRGYAGLQMSSVFCLIVSRLCQAWHRTQASKKYHDDLIGKVLYLPVAFFDVTPIGRIINRFSQDMATIDEDLANTMSQVIGMGGGALGSIGAIAGSTKGILLILVVPLGYLYTVCNKYFRQSNTEIARLESISRSPIYADFSQTLSGTSTIRAYKQEQRFVAKLDSYANTNTVPGVLQQIAQQWLGIRLDFLGAVIMFCMGVLSAASNGSDLIPAGYLALGLSYSIQLTSLLKMAVRVTATMEAQFNSVERIRHYIEHTAAEDQPLLDLNNNSSGSGKGGSTVVTATATQTLTPPADIEMASAVRGTTLMAGDKEYLVAPADWPSAGRVEFRRASMRYRDGPLVLKQVSFTVEPHQKIGIAGRTGCGKSSLMVSLFRIEDLAEGTIFIDDIDISRLSLHQLRSNLCIIPQDPVMFSATVRFNLDPFNERSDEDVWRVLEDVKLKDHVLSLPGQLAELVAEGGDNFSAGQRQLICIARAVLRRPKILVLDEATASIDSDTDNFIQQMIRLKFQHCTVLTIAHRLHTIIDSDKVLVMDAGKVGEYDTPAALLAKTDSADQPALFKLLWERHVSEGGVPAANTINIH